MINHQWCKNILIVGMLITLIASPLGIRSTKAAADFVVITGLLDGTLPDGTPKAIELYINGTIDLSTFSLERSANGGAFGSTTALSGVYSDEFVYLMQSSQEDEFISVFGISGDFSNIVYVGIVTGNGDDGFRIIDGSNNVIDQVWYENTTDSYRDSFWYRNDGSGPDNNWISSNWGAGGNDFLDGMTAAQIAAAVPFGTYSRIAMQSIPNGGGSAFLAGITITNNSTNSCDFSAIKHFVPPGGDPVDSGEMPMQWELGSSGCGTLNVDLAFSYSDSELANGNSVTESNLEVFKHIGDITWENQCGTFICSLDTGTNIVMISGVDALSSWTIGDSATLGNNNPTAIALSNLSGASTISTPVILFSAGLVILLSGLGILLIRRCKMI